METNTNTQENLRDQIEKLPTGAGVYLFKNSDEQVLYVGKAKNIKKRVKNHFQKPNQHIFNFISQIADIDYIGVNSENEALLLEQELIKKIQPRYNVEWKDDKNYFFIALSNDDLPRVYITHQPRAVNFANGNLAKQPPEYFGPFVNGRELKLFLGEIRKALPYRSCRNLPKKPCFYASLDLCRAPCAHPEGYLEIIASLRVLFGLYQGNNLRLECYDISNLSGTLTVGSLVVFQNGKPDKNFYRKFKIKTVKGQNDVAALKEVLLRRWRHTEWVLPDLIILDGGRGQLKAARGISIPVLGLAKIGKNDGKLFSPYSKNYAQLKKMPPSLSAMFLHLRDEAHRFAISYNKVQRDVIIKN